MLTSPARALHARNSVTYAGVMLGLGAMAAALAGHAGTAGALIGLAVVADTLDGRFARQFASDAGQAAIGAELDSLCDACTFGMAPVICTVTLAASGRLALFGWLAGALYLVALVTRLAYYNVMHGSVSGFVGLPGPVAALIWATALCFSQRLEMLAPVLVAAAVAMISPWQLPRPAGLRLFAFLLWPVAVVATLSTR